MPGLINKVFMDILILCPHKRIAGIKLPVISKLYPVFKFYTVYYRRADILRHPYPCLFRPVDKVIVIIPVICEAKTEIFIDFAFNSYFFGYPFLRPQVRVTPSPALVRPIKVVKGRRAE